MVENFFTRELSPVKSDKDLNRLMEILEVAPVDATTASLAVSYERKGIETIDEVDSKNYYRQYSDNGLILTVQVKLYSWDSGYEKISALADETIAGLEVEREEKIKAQYAEKVAERDALQKQIDALNREIKQ